VVEGQREGRFGRVDHPGPAGVIAALGHAAGRGDENGRDGVQARVAVWVRVGVELAAELDVEAGFLAGLADRGRLERFAVVDEASRKGPARRRVLPLDQDDSPVSGRRLDFDDDVHGRDGFPVCVPRGSFRHAKVIVGFAGRPVKLTAERKLGRHCEEARSGGADAAISSSKDSSPRTGSPCSPG